MFVVRKQSKMINKCFRFSEDLLDKIKATAEENNISTNELVCQCCEYALGNMKKVSK
jgi:hypothetical protein